MPDKQELSEISSEGEFNDAKRMQVYPENATEVYIIEQKQQICKDKNQLFCTNGDESVPQFLVDTFRQKKRDGAQATRDRGLKHLTKVGYCGDGGKKIPRWAVDQEYVQQIALYQKNNQSDLAETVFGKVARTLSKEVNIAKQIASYK